MINVFDDRPLKGKGSNGFSYNLKGHDYYTLRAGVETSMTNWDLLNNVNSVIIDQFYEINRIYP